MGQLINGSGFVRKKVNGSSYESGIKIKKERGQEEKRKYCPLKSSLLPSINFPSADFDYQNGHGKKVGGKRGGRRGRKGNITYITKQSKKIITFVT